jgi:hypothetical protein
MAALISAAGDRVEIRPRRYGRVVLSSHHRKAIHMKPPRKETSMRVVRSAAVQMRPMLYSREETLEKVVREIHELGSTKGPEIAWPITDRSS